MTRRRLISTRPWVLAIMLAAAGGVQAEPPEPDAQSSNVLRDVEVVDAPTRSFMPKYRNELFAFAGYMGMFTKLDRQWPTLLAGAEYLFLRPGRFDIGLLLDGQLGRSDEPRGRFSFGLGPEVMWRFWEASLYDVALLVHGAYTFDTSHPERPLIRGGGGLQASLVRFAAIQLTYEFLYATTPPFSNDKHILHGFSLTLKLGISPMFGSWPQYATAPMPIVDRSLLVCQDAAQVCVGAAAMTQTSGRRVLCSAALDGLDVRRFPVGGDDAVTAYLSALRELVQAQLGTSLEVELAKLIGDHHSSMNALHDYLEMQRTLRGGEVLSKRYSYLVTPAMIRDWLGCDPDGLPQHVDGTELDRPCPTASTCMRDAASGPL